MQVAETIADTGIDKGVIVSKNGFTKDGAEFAKFKNIGIVELREINETVLDIQDQEFEVATIQISSRVTIRRPEVLGVAFEYVDSRIPENGTFNMYSTSIILADGSRKPETFY